MEFKDAIKYLFDDFKIEECIQDIRFNADYSEHSGTEETHPAVVKFDEAIEAIKEWLESQDPVFFIADDIGGTVIETEGVTELVEKEKPVTNDFAASACDFCQNRMNGADCESFPKRKVDDKVINCLGFVKEVGGILKQNVTEKENLVTELKADMSTPEHLQKIPLNRIRSGTIKKLAEEKGVICETNTWGDYKDQLKQKYSVQSIISLSEAQKIEIIASLNWAY